MRDFSSGYISQDETIFSPSPNCVENQNGISRTKRKSPCYALFRINPSLPKRGDFNFMQLLIARRCRFMLLRSPRSTIRGIQQVIDSGTIGKVDVKPERLVDLSLVDGLKNPGLSMLSIKNSPDRLPSPILPAQIQSV
jgi:hypothetical protein